MEEKTKLPLILVLALPILLLISTECARVNFELFGQTFYLLPFIFPITFYASTLISKKTDSRMGITLVILALIMQCLFFVIKWVMLGTVDYVLMEMTFLAFFMSHFLILLGYEVLKETKKTDKFAQMFFILVISTIIATMFYMSIFTEITILSLIITVIIEIIYDLIMAKLLVK